MTDDNAPVSKPTKGEAIGKLLDAFEGAANVDNEGVQYWLARDLYPILGYASWQRFEPIVAKARAACEAIDEPADYHFIQSAKMIEIGKGASRHVEDIELTRLACYMIAQNGDSSKPEIAAAQMYFAVQTRRQEVADIEAAQSPLTEDQKRVRIREEVKTHNKSLSSAAKAVGVVQPLDYAIFKNEGYKGLYADRDMRGIQRRKGLARNQDILDHMPSGELAANLFVATQTEEKLRRDRDRIKSAGGKAEAGRVHKEVGKTVRATIEKIGGTMPEDYPAVEHVKEARKRLKAEEKEVAKLAAPPKSSKKKSDAA